MGVVSTGGGVVSTAGVGGVASCFGADLAAAAGAGAESLAEERERVSE